MEPPAPPPPEPSPTPGKIRTWWHPLLASLLRWQLGSHYQLQEEVPVGQKPLQIDILLLHQEQGDLPDSARQILAGLVEHLGAYTLLEFKSPTDTLRAGDFQTFLAYALLYRAQHHPLLDPEQLHLLVLAPRLTRPYREELRTLGVTLEQHEPGIWRLHGGQALHPTWVLETEHLVGLDHPLLSLLSPRFLENKVVVYELLRQGGYTELVVYLGQQIIQFQLRGKEFAMQHLGTDNQMAQALQDLLYLLPPEERLRGLREDQLAQALQDLLALLPPKDRLKGLSPKDRLKGLSPEERLEGLSPEELERLRQLLLTEKKPGSSSPPS